MYRLQPHYESAFLDNPSKVMYATEKFHKDLDAAFGNRQSTTSCLPSKHMRNKTTASSVNSSATASQNGVSEIEQRQLDLLNRLRQVGVRLDTLAGSAGNSKKRGSDQAKDVKRQKTESVSQAIPDEPIPRPSELIDGDFATYGRGCSDEDVKNRFPLNIMLNRYASPPASLLSLACLVRDRVKTFRVGVKAFMHSSVVTTDAADVLAKRIQDFNLSTAGDDPQLMINFIWKKDFSLKEPVLLHGACVQSRTTKIIGEAAIAKYLASLADLYPVAGSSPDAAFLTTEYWLFTAAAFSKPSYPEIRTNALNEMDGVLSRRQFLVGERITFADVLLWSTMNQTGFNYKRSWDPMPSRVKKWFTTMTSLKTFQPVLTFLY